MKKIGGITKRWLKDIFSVILVLVLSVSVAACLFIRTYYYTSIKNVLETNSGELITTFFNIYGANSEDGFAIAGREFIENCGMLDLMEIWIYCLTRRCRFANRLLVPYNRTDSRGYHCRINDTRTCIYSVYSKTSEKYRQCRGQGRGRRPQRPNRKLQIR